MLDVSSGTDALLIYLLRLADTALILGQRNAEWCGHGPALEEDIAQTNISLDLIGQARLLYTRAAEIELALNGTTKTEDDYAYWRDESQFLNLTLAELPHSGPTAGTAAVPRDYSVTVVRNFLYSSLMVELWGALQQSTDEGLRAIAGKSIKETRYHLTHAQDWLIRFGDGTEESHRRAQAALEHLLPYSNEFFVDDAIDTAVAETAVAPLPSSLRPAWEARVTDTAFAATLKLPDATQRLTQGKAGNHSEHLGFLLAEMQSLARAHPGATW